MIGARKANARPRRASAVARLSLAYAVVFIVISALFFAGAMHLVAQKNRERLQSLVFADSRALKAKIDEAPAALRLDIARAIVGARIAQGKDRVQYALVTPSGEWSGNLSASDVKVSRGDRLTLTTRGWLSVAAIDRVDLGQGGYILLGRTQDEAGLERDVMGVGLLALALAGFVAFVIGPMASLRLVRRVEAVNQACEAFGAGDLTARAPGAGASDEFGALARSVNAMFERIDDLVGGLREVSNQAAHDLRTPIARLRSDLDTVRAADTLDQARTAAEAAIAETNAILETFDALLDLAEIQAGSTVVLSPVDLSLIARQAADLYRPVAEDAGIALVLDLNPAHVTGEQALLIRVVANLLDNAIKYCPRGSTVCVSVKPVETGVELAVSDDGPGVPAAARNDLLKPRVRGTTSSPGLGLGLALAAAVAARHGADLQLGDGPQNRGLRLSLTFAPTDPVA
ncbi:putative sensor histidine kinase TcrY [Brevundimonas sp. SH203]|uniref:sensor histidine kinase n=1 Tax=Brevundimonas sp. SH203 TaxID=345167 RepID=UPI0009C6AFA3|nr:HAMP domain-containing sensor histidine kinase [Brevundimonas sp. SH203]GAW40280.1 putative sensor histidine kinase TcrY [Brevundimonas sp. SH203]